MKKLIILLLLISLTLGLLASCVPNDTSSGGEISGDASTNVEVTDEAVIAEIKALLEKYNEYVLIVNMCEGAIDADKDAVFVHNLVHNKILSYLPLRDKYGFVHNLVHNKITLIFTAARQI